MKFEKVTDSSVHIIDNDEFLGCYVGSIEEGRPNWKYKPSDCLLTERQMDAIKKQLKKLNS